MSSFEIIILSIVMAAIAGGLYVGIRLMRSGKRRSSLARGITGVLITGATLSYVGYLGVSLWDWHDRRTNTVRIFRSQFDVVPPEGVTHLQATYGERGGFRENHLRWECSAEVLAALLPEYTQMDLIDHRIEMNALSRQPEWWDLSFAAPGIEIRSHGDDDANRVILAYDPAQRTAWYYNSYVTKEYRTSHLEAPPQ